MFWIDPVDKSSRIDTSWPAAISASARCDPMNPAPPVMNARTNSVSGELENDVGRSPGGPAVGMDAVAGDERATGRGQPAAHLSIIQQRSKRRPDVADRGGSSHHARVDERREIVRQ